MRLVRQGMALFFSLVASIFKTFRVHISPPPQSAADIELQPVTTQSAVAQAPPSPLVSDPPQPQPQPQPERELQQFPPRDHPAINQQLQLMERLENLQWDDFKMSVCFMSSIQIATAASQPQIPALLYAFSLAILVAFSALCIAKTTSENFPRTSQWLRNMAIFIAAAAFYLAAAMPLPMCLKWVVVVVYIISFLAIMLAHFL